MKKEELQNQATSLGIDIDRRWGEERLREEIGRAQASNFVIEGADQLEDVGSSVDESGAIGITNATSTAKAIEESIKETHRVVAKNVFSTEGNRVDYMNSRVLAIWEGQSVTLPIHERKRRITKAMIDKGFDDIIGQIKWPD